eukprot:3421061-Pyramimonas_sp.AAC.1
MGVLGLWYGCATGVLVGLWYGVWVHNGCIGAVVWVRDGCTSRAVVWVAMGVLKLWYGCAT